MADPKIDSKFRPEKFSKRHHYLPIFYLKGFTNSEGTFYVYDKITGKILEKQKPNSKYFEKHLNNYKFDGEVKLTLEESYFTPQDTRVAPLFVKIRKEGFDPGSLTSLEKFELMAFLMSLYWRLPGTNAKAVELMKKEGVSNRYFGFFKDGKQLTDEEVPEICNNFLNDEQSQRLYKTIIPIANGAMEELYKLHDEFHLYTMFPTADPLVIGDEPFLIKNDNFSLDNLLGQLVFPLSSSRLLILAPKAPKFLDIAVTTYTNLSVLHQARRYISCGSKEYLLKLVAYYDTVKSINMTERLLESLFNTVHSQSKFDNWEEYSKSFQK